MTSAHVTSSSRRNNNHSTHHSFSHRKTGHVTSKNQQPVESMITKAQNFLNPASNKMTQHEVKKGSNEIENKNSQGATFNTPAQPSNTYINLPSAAQILSGGHRGAIGGGDIVPLSSSPRKSQMLKQKQWFGWRLHLLYYGRGALAQF